MSDYIDRRAAIDAVGDVHPLDYNSQAIADRLKSLPSADVEPVRHGRWIFGHTLGHSWMKCSECLVSQGGQTACFSYCPNCGARMDGEQDADEITE